MLDRKALRQDWKGIFDKLKARGYQGDYNAFEVIESERRLLQAEVERLQNERNVQSKVIGQAKAKGESADEALKAMQAVGGQLKSQEKSLQAVQSQFDKLCAEMPNIPHESVPDGLSEDDNVLLRQWGDRPVFDFTPRDHIDLGEQLNGMDFEAATQISGARFSVLKGPIARLHRALGQFMLDEQASVNGYEEMTVPFLVKRSSLFGTGQLPKMDEDIFYITGDWDLGLVPTGEVPLTNYHRGQILNGIDLPIKIMAHTPCFRSEAGSYGKDTRGMIRQHQFEKVELVQLVRPEDSYDALEALTHHAEHILQKLELPYQVVALSKGDLGFSTAKTYDLEVWMPGQDAYREISSCSNFEDFQARRMQIRFRDKPEDKPQLLHTLNGSGLPLGRALVAVMENYQLADGSIRVPDVLQPYMRCESIDPS